MTLAPCAGEKVSERKLQEWWLALGKDMAMLFQHTWMPDRKVKSRLQCAAGTLPRWLEGPLDLDFRLWMLEAYSLHTSSSLPLGLQICDVSARFLLSPPIHMQAAASAEAKNRAVVPVGPPQGCRWLRPPPGICPCSWILLLFSWGISKKRMPTILPQSQSNWFCIFLMMSRKVQSTSLRGRDSAEWGSPAIVFILAPGAMSIYSYRWKRIRAKHVR